MGSFGSGPGAEHGHGSPPTSAMTTPIYWRDLPGARGRRPSRFPMPRRLKQLHLDEISRHVAEGLRRSISTEPDGTPPASSTCRQHHPIFLPSCAELTHEASKRVLARTGLYALMLVCSAIKD